MLNKEKFKYDYYYCCFGRLKNSQNIQIYYVLQSKKNENNMTTFFYLLNKVLSLILNNLFFLTSLLQYKSLFLLNN